MILETDKGLLLGAKVELIRPDRVVAEWTHRSITPNDHFLYIAAKYVEADKPNENKHYWSFEALQKSQASIVNSPINVMHQPHNIVGVMVDQEMLYPTAQARDYSQDEREKMANNGQALPDGSFPIKDKADLSNAISAYGRAKNKEAAKRHIIKRAKALGATDMLPDAWTALLLEDITITDNEPAVAAYDYAQPYIEVLGALWKFYYPQTVAQIEAAQEMGSLWISMECISETVTRVDRDGTETHYPFKGGSVKDYDFHGESEYCRLNEPHFVGAGLVLPPAKPGWKGAEVRDLLAAMEDDGEALYEQIKAETPQLSPTEWENLMLAFLSHHASSKG